MILGDVLEDLLDRASTARREDDAVDGDGDEAFFAQAVGEVLGNMGGKGCWGFVTVEPGGDAETITGFAGPWIAFADFEGRGEPLKITVAWSFGEDTEGVLEFAVGPFCKPGA